SERLSGDRTAAQPAVERTAQAGGPDVLLRIERLETQIRQLTGVIEQLQFRNQQLENQVRHMQEESDGAKGARRPADTLRPQGAPAAPPTIAPRVRPGHAFDPTLNPSAPGAPQTLGSIPAGPAPKPGEMADASMGLPQTSRGNLPGTAVATLAPSQTPKDEF